jgi:glycosyltransferase involved in cell wall biosynthesis
MWLMSMLREIAREICAMDICCKGAHVGEMAPEAKELGAKVFHCPLDVTHVAFARRLTRVLRAGKYDIVHNHLNAYSGFPVWIAHRVGIPALTTFHSTRFDPEDPRLQIPGVRGLRMLYQFISTRYAVRKSDMVTGVSKTVLDKFVHQENQFSSMSDVLYLGVSLPEASTGEERSAFRKSLGWAENTPIVLHVGSFKETKNHSGVLAVFERVLGALPHARLLLAGEGHLRTKIENDTKRRQIDHAVRFLGLRDDVPRLMTLCDVLLFPSLQEGFPLVALEAGGAELPVVASKIPAMSEAIQDGVTGILHALDDLPGMADSVVKLLLDQSLRRRLGRAGRGRVQQEFSTSGAAHRLLSLYGRLISRPR